MSEAGDLGPAFIALLAVFFSGFCVGWMWRSRSRASKKTAGGGEHE